jgi:Tol biopolymer transport system component
VPRIRAISFGLVAILAGCSPAGGPATAAPTTTSAPATSVPSDAPVQTAAPTAVVPTAPPGLSGRLLFSRFEEATHTFKGMFASAADGSGEVEVPMPWTEGGGRWSTSGDLIAVPTQLDNGRVGTAILDATGTVLRVLAIADEGLNLPCTTWSPDDTRLGCEGWDDSDAARVGIYTVRSSDGGDIQRLTTPPAGMADDDGDWSSDGRIVFKRYAGNEAPGPLLLVDAAGGDPTPLTSGGEEDPGRFSPDGKLVATSSGGVIQVFDVTGAKVSTIEGQAAFLFGPAWSPDGAWLAFSSTPGGQFLADLFIARPDGADRYQVTRTSANEITVDWGADPG